MTTMIAMSARRVTVVLIVIVVVIVIAIVIVIVIAIGIGIGIVIVTIMVSRLVIDAMLRMLGGGGGSESWMQHLSWTPSVLHGLCQHLATLISWRLL